MGKKSVEDMINEIDIYIDSCKYAAFSSDRIIVPKSELQSMLKELKLKMPSDLERSKKIMRNKEGILTDARTRAEAIIMEANSQAQRMVEESEIVTLANLQAEEILRQADMERNSIVEQANAEAAEIRMGMMEYTVGMLNDIEKYVQTTMEVERSNYENLLQSLQNNIDVIGANRSEIEEQQEAMLQAQQPEVVPEPQYVDSAFAPQETYEMPQEEPAPQPEEFQTSAEEAEGNADDEVFEYEDEEDDLFGE